jgi:hypothetical protein
MIGETTLSDLCVNKVNTKYLHMLTFSYKNVVNFLYVISVIYVLYCSWEFLISHSCVVTQHT